MATRERPFAVPVLVLIPLVHVSRFRLLDALNSFVAGTWLRPRSRILTSSVPSTASLLLRTLFTLLRVVHVVSVVPRGGANTRGVTRWYRTPVPRCPSERDTGPAFGTSEGGRVQR
jgi:hypothetical protein